MLKHLETILRSVGEALIKLRAEGPIAGHWADASQFKADADRIAHDMLVNGLNEMTQDIPVISEEDEPSQARTRPEQYWLIDPIDGTASYAGGYDGFVTQAALMQNDRPVLSGIYAPANDIFYDAEQGKGARVNGSPLRLSGKTTQGGPTLIDNYPEPRATGAAAYEQMGFHRYVESGSISLKICRVADGTADLFFKDVILRDWDVAAPALILTEAGGTLTNISGREYDYSGDWVKPGIIAASYDGIREAFLAWHETHRMKTP